MRRPATYILLLVIYCICYSSSGRPTPKPKCLGRYIHMCAVGDGRSEKRSDIDDIGQATDLGDDGERPNIEEDREGERRDSGRGSGGRESGGFRGTKEKDYFRSGSNRQLSDERDLVDIDNHRGNSPRSAQLDSAIGRLRSLLGRTTDLDVDDRGEAEEKREERQEEEKEEEEKRKEEEQDTPKRSLIDRDRNYVLNETQALLSKILSDIEDRLDQPPVPRSVSRE